MNEQDCKKLAELLFPDVDKTPDYYEEKYPYRKLPNKAEVTRLGPSPTGLSILAISTVLWLMRELHIRTAVYST